MGLLDRYEAWAEQYIASGRPKNPPPRHLTDADRGAFFDAATEQPPRPRTIEQARLAIRNRNPVRWRRLQKEYRWMTKQAVKLGISPEEARWLL